MPFIGAHAGQPGHLFFQPVQLLALFLADLVLGLHVRFQLLPVRSGLGQFQTQVGQPGLHFLAVIGGGHVIQHGLPFFRRQGCDAVAQQAQVAVAQAQLFLHLHEVTAEGRQVLQVFVYLALAVAVGGAELLPGGDHAGLAVPVHHTGPLVGLAVADLGKELEHGHAVGRLVVLEGRDHARGPGHVQALRQILAGHGDAVAAQVGHQSRGLLFHGRRGGRSGPGGRTTPAAGRFFFDDDGFRDIVHEKLLQ